MESVVGLDADPDMSMDPKLLKGEGNDGWWYLNTAEMITTYARTNPFEDFAEHFQAAIPKQAGFPALPVGPNKSAFITNMLTTLAANA